MAKRSAQTDRIRDGVDSKVENIVDLGLVNYVRHPSDPKYVVFRFSDEKRANDFEKELKANKIWYEKGEGDTKNRTYTLFGIHNKHFNRVQRLNFLVEAKNRTFLIRNKVFRYALLLISIGTVILAFVGYCTRPDLADVLEKIEVNE